MSRTPGYVIAGSGVAVLVIMAIAGARTVAAVLALLLISLRLRQGWKLR